MRRTLRAKVAFVAGTLVLMLLAGSARAQDAAAPASGAAMPDGDGKALVRTLCVGCHALDTTVNRRATAAEWRVIVGTMIERGAQITEEEAATIVRYLGEHYAPRPGGAGTPAVAPAPTAAQPALPDAPGKDVLTGKCFQCHGQSMWRDLRQDRRGWEGVIYRMIGRGALWTEDEIASMADYLAKAFPPAGAQRP